MAYDRLGCAPCAKAHRLKIGLITRIAGVVQLRMAAPFGARPADGLDRMVTLAGFRLILYADTNHDSGGVNAFR